MSIYIYCFWTTDRSIIDGARATPFSSIIFVQMFFSFFLVHLTVFVVVIVAAFFFKVIISL